jgi:tetratricopeptide (TPR) repeat protein
LLDKIVDDATRAIPIGLAGTRGARLGIAKNDSAAIGQILESNGFELFIPTDALSDALFARTEDSRTIHTFDCDTSSFIYLTVAENLQLPLSMIDITLASGAGHNYVRWQIDNVTTLDWDTNGRVVCRTPSGLPPTEGKPMTRAQVIGYSRALRAMLWERLKQPLRALTDLRDSISMYPESGLARNNLAWLVATVDLPGRANLFDEALQQAEKAVELRRDANRLDTLACVFALRGAFDRAIEVENDAISLGGSTPTLRERLIRFGQKRDCTGLE